MVPQYPWIIIFKNIYIYIHISPFWGVNQKIFQVVSSKFGSPEHRVIRVDPFRAAALRPLVSSASLYAWEIHLGSSLSNAREPRHDKQLKTFRSTGSVIRWTILLVEYDNIIISPYILDPSGNLTLCYGINGTFSLRVKWIPIKMLMFHYKLYSSKLPEDMFECPHYIPIRLQVQFFLVKSLVFLG